jgi:hypothetical protein
MRWSGSGTHIGRKESAKGPTDDPAARLALDKLVQDIVGDASVAHHLDDG